MNDKLTFDDFNKCAKEWLENTVDKPIAVQVAPELIELLNDDSSSDTKAEKQDEAIYFTTSSLSLREQCLRSKAWRLAYLQSKINAAHAAKERTPYPY